MIEWGAMEHYLVVVRHGRTEWNRVERFRGRADIGLDGVGVEQARAASRSLARYQPRAIYTSPLERAARTAGVIGQALGLESVALPQLIDMDFGDWTGLTLEQAARKDGQLYKLWQKAPHRKQPRGRELPTPSRPSGGRLPAVKNFFHIGPPFTFRARR